MTRSEYVQPGDTILRLAQRHLGSSDRWREIATVNRLAYPYVVEDPAPWRAAGATVLAPGDIVLIPLAPDAVPVTQEQGEQIAYGIDLGWSESTFDLVREGNRLALDRGVKNLAKALYRRLVTRPGELPAHPTYGCMAYQHLGHPMTEWRARLAALDVATALRQDPRVLAASVEVEYVPPGELRATAVVTPIPPAETFTLIATIGATSAATDV
jgi:phage baseplate assembly protein W